MAEGRRKAFKNKAPNGQVLVERHVSAVTPKKRGEDVLMALIKLI
jgi:hypothetical protein